MPVEKSAGAVVFHREPDGQIEYLLIQNSAGKDWGFPKGNIDASESVEATARRETEEETGLKSLRFIDGFKETAKTFLKAKFEYQFKLGFKPGQTVLKFITFFLAESTDKEVRLSFEHSDYIWLEFQAALDKIDYKINKKILTKADEFLKEHDRV
jgi:8-oxo-dGTP pyrophosphatase MutT (NUDIX family)